MSAYLMVSSSFMNFVHSWMMCSWVSSDSLQYLHLRVSWPFLWFILTVIILVLALSIAWLCFLVSLSMYSGLHFLGVVHLFSPVVDFCFVFFLCFLFYFLYNWLSTILQIRCIIDVPPTCSHNSCSSLAFVFGLQVAMSVTIPQWCIPIYQRCVVRGIAL